MLSFCLLSADVQINIYAAIILPVVIFGRGTWSLTLREVNRLGFCGNITLRKTFGPDREEV